jgi:hypothetical protein
MTTLARMHRSQLFARGTKAKPLALASEGPVGLRPVQITCLIQALSHTHIQSLAYPQEL